MTSTNNLQPGDDSRGTRSLVLELGKQVRAFFDGLNRALDAQGRVYTNVANGLHALKSSLLVANRSLWRKQQEVISEVKENRDEMCRQHTETGTRLKSMEQEMQSLRALLLCMDHNDSQRELLDD